MLRFQAPHHSGSEDEVALAITCATLNLPLRTQFFKLIIRDVKRMPPLKTIGATVALTELNEKRIVFFSLNGDQSQGGFHQIYLQMSKALIYLVEATDDPESLKLDRDYLHHHLLKPPLKKHAPILVLLLVNEPLQSSKIERISQYLQLPSIRNRPWLISVICQETREIEKEHLNEAIKWLIESLTLMDSLEKIQKAHFVPFHGKFLYMIQQDDAFLLSQNTWLEDAFSNDSLYFRIIMTLIYHELLEMTFKKFDHLSSTVLEDLFHDYLKTNKKNLISVMSSRTFSVDGFFSSLVEKELDMQMKERVHSLQEVLECFLRQHESDLFLGEAAEKIILELKTIVKEFLFSDDFINMLSWYDNTFNGQVLQHVPYLRFLLLQDFIPKFFFHFVVTKEGLISRLRKKWYRITFIKQLRNLFSQLVTADFLSEMLNHLEEDWSLIISKPQEWLVKSNHQSMPFIIKITFSELLPELEVELTCQKCQLAELKQEAQCLRPCIVAENQEKILYSSNSLLIDDYSLLLGKVHLLLIYSLAINKALASPRQVKLAREILHPDIIHQFAQKFKYCRHYNWELHFQAEEK